MLFIKEQIDARHLPEIPFCDDAEENRQLIVEILSKNIYGRTPSFKSQVSAIQTDKYKDCLGIGATHIHYNLTATTPSGNFTFKFTLSYPKKSGKIPLIVLNSFDPSIPNGFIPEEEIVRRGVAIARFCYTDIVADDAENCFETGISPMFPRDKNRTDNWGSIGMWAWASSRVLDFLLTLGMFDEKKIAVAGHSRLGKTALWCASQDTRFTHVFSNNSGCSGTAITRGKKGEDIEFITKTFPHWFCDKYKDYAGDKIKDMPFDQHFLLASIAPRKIAIGVASLDEWADPESEYLSCHVASSAWKKRGISGIIAPQERFIDSGEFYNDGNIAFHKREGTHAICREDWNRYIDFFLK